MTPPGEATSPQISRTGGFGRIAAIGALVLAIIAVAWMVLGGDDDGVEYNLVFETGGQLVNGNQVLIGGKPVGTIDEIELTDNAQAKVRITVDRELHEGTSAVIRSTSLSGIANRYISITPGPDNADVLEDGSLITQVDTTTPVDLDQLFNTFREPEREGLQDIIQGSADVYAGRGPEANETYRYLSPALTATDRLFREINRDEKVLTDFLVNGSRVVTAVAERRDDLSGLVSNTNQALGAIAERNEELDRALTALPPALRQANTTFSNLRLTLDDLDPLVAATKPATKNLEPFLRQLRKVVGKSVPVFRNLRLSVNRKGKANDLADAAADLPTLRARASSAVGPSVAAMARAEPVLRFYRPYAPDLLGAIGKLGQISAYYDANGHYARVAPAGLGVFCYDDGTLPAPCDTGSGDLEPIPLSRQLDDYTSSGNFGVFRRCPGGSTQPIAGSNPFLDGGGLTSPAPPGDCTATDVPPGP